MKSLGSYTLGDQYVSPERRLSAMLTQQGSKGGPSNSWQETMGRIAQQLAGAYIGYKDTQNRNKAFDAQTGLEPDSKRPPTNAEAMASPGMRDLQLQSMTGIAGDGKGSTVTAPLPDDQLMQQGGIPGTLDKISRYNSGLSGDPINSAAYELDGDQNLTDGINLQAQNFQNEMEQRRAASNVPRPRDFKAELAQGMQGYQQDPNNRIVNEKMNPRDFAMQQLRGLENNPYAKRILAQMMMQNADRDYTAEQLKNAQGFKTSERTAGQEYSDAQLDKKLGAAEKIANLKSSLPVTGIREYQQALQNKLIPEGTSFMDYLQNKSLKVLNPLQKAQLEKTQIENASTLKGQGSALESLRRTIRTGEQLLEHPGREMATGGSSFMSMIPGTDAKGFSANLETFKSQNFLPAVAQMKGAGALSDAEGKKLTDAIGALDPQMPQDEFKKSLKQIVDDLHAAEKRMPGYKGGGQGRRSTDTQERRTTDIPEGVSKEQWGVMSPEQKALFK